MALLYAKAHAQLIFSYHKVYNYYKVESILQKNLTTLTFVSSYYEQQLSVLWALEWPITITVLVHSVRFFL